MYLDWTSSLSTVIPKKKNINNGTGNNFRTVLYILFLLGSLGFKEEEGYKANLVNVVESDPEWRSGGTTLQGQSTQRFITAEPIRVDPSKKIELVLRLVAR